MSNPIAFQFAKPPNGIKRIHEYRKFVVFIATPDQFREKEFGCKDQKGFSKLNGISERQLNNWKKIDEFWPDVNRISGIYLKQYTPAVKGAMLNKILKTGDAAEVKLWHQLVEGWSEKTDKRHLVSLDVEIARRRPIPDDKREAVWQVFQNFGMIPKGDNPQIKDGGKNNTIEQPCRAIMVIEQPA